MNKSYKTVEREDTILTAIEDAMSEIESLKDEMNENRDNAPNDELGQKWGDIADELDNLTEFDEGQIHEKLQDLHCSYPELVHKRKGRGLSRNARYQNASSALHGALAALENCDIDEIDEVDQEELDEAMSHIQEIVDSLPEVDFPTMFG